MGRRGVPVLGRGEHHPAPRMSDETTTLGGRAQRWLQRAVALPYVWLLLFFLTPFLIILKISVAEPLVAQPPFTPLFEWGQRGIEGIRLTFENYAFLFQDGYYGIIYLSSRSEERRVGKECRSRW